jgi:hypothetical protein
LSARRRLRLTGGRREVNEDPPSPSQPVFLEPGYSYAIEAGHHHMEIDHLLRLSAMSPLRAASRGDPGDPVDTP